MDKLVWPFNFMIQVGMRRKMTSFVMGMGLMLSFSTFAAPVNGNDLLDMLTTKDEGFSGLGLLYVVGVVNAVDVNRFFFEVNPSKMDSQVAKNALISLGTLWGCKPENATYGQVTDVVTAYLQKRPEVRHLGSTMLIAAAIKEAWPCASL